VGQFAVGKHPPFDIAPLPVLCGRAGFLHSTTMALDAYARGKVDRGPGTGRKCTQGMQVEGGGGAWWGATSVDTI
jgi:hypothetical protein